MTKQEHERLSPILDKIKEKNYSAETALIMGSAIFSPKSIDKIKTMDEIEKLLNESKNEKDFCEKIEPYTVNVNP